MRVVAEQVTAVILSGGRGQRMGGEDKGLVPYRGKPLILHVLDVMRQQTQHLQISSNRNFSTYQEFGYPVVRDELPGYQGPLAGILSAMQTVKTPYLLSAPCDSPFLPMNYLQTMLEALGQAKLAVAHDGQRMQPVFSLISVDCQASLREYLNRGESSIRGWLREQQAVSVPFPANSKMFVNINTPQDLESSHVDSL